MAQDRRQSREAALAVLFHDEFPSDEALCEVPLDAYAGNLVEGAHANKVQIDNLLGKASTHWRIERMGLVDRNVLRIAVWELLQDVPVAVVINEAIEVARLFGDVDSAAFVNGVLDAVARAVAGATVMPVPTMPHPFLA